MEAAETDATENVEVIDIVDCTEAWLVRERVEAMEDRETDPTDAIELITASEGVLRSDRMRAVLK